MALSECSFKTRVRLIRSTLCISLYARRLCVVLCEMRILPGLCGPVKNLNQFKWSQYSQEDFGDGIARPLCDFMTKIFGRTYNQPKPRNANNPHGGDKTMKTCIVCDCKGSQRLSSSSHCHAALPVGGCDEHLRRTCACHGKRRLLVHSKKALCSVSCTSSWVNTNQDRRCFDIGWSGTGASA